MQFTIAAFTALMAASTAFALPAGGPQQPPVQTVTISFSNDQSGRNAPITATLDGTVIPISQYLASTPICGNGAGHCEASSAYTVAFVQGASCAITAADGHLIAGLDAQRTFADLDGNPAASTPISLDGANLRCEL